MVAGVVVGVVGVIGVVGVVGAVEGGVEGRVGGGGVVVC